MLRRRHSREYRRWPRIALLTIGLGLIGWSWGLIAFVLQIPDSVADETRPTDAIVVLTGGSLRLEKGFELLSQGLAERMFVSGVRKGVPIDELLRIANLTPEDLECCVTLGYMAEDTGSNAIETAIWIRANHVSSIRLVTSSYHMPRSLLEFRGTIPGVEILPHPVFPRRVMLDEWWIRPGTASLVITEYNKYLLAATRHWLRGIEGA